MLILNLFGIIISIPIIVIPLVTVAKFCRETSMTMFLIAGIMIFTWSLAGLISSLCCWKVGFQEFIYMRSHVFILFIVVLLGTMAWWQSRTDSRLYTYYDWETFKNCMVKKQVCQRNLRNGLERLSPFASHSLQVLFVFKLLCYTKFACIYTGMISSVVISIIYRINHHLYICDGSFSYPTRAYQNEPS